MKIISVLIFMFVTASSLFAIEYKTGEEVLTAMHKKYEGKWYKTLTFEQKTTNYKPDGTSEAHTWYEAFTMPGKLRIDMTPLEKGDGVIFADGRIYPFKDGKLGTARDFVHPLLVLGFDVYVQPVEKTIEQIKGMGISLLITESNLMTASRVADRLFAIDRGEIIFEGEPGRAFENPDVMKTIRG
jgi:outer membrane lipoprotein-sorting protein